MGLDSMRGILPQTPMALLVVKEQVSNTQTIYLHMFQLPENRITLQYVHNHPRIPGKCRGTGLTRVVCHHHLQHHGVFFCCGFTCPFLNIYKPLGFSLDASQITLHGAEQSLNKMLKNAVGGN